MWRVSYWRRSRMFSALSADLKWRIVTLGSLTHSPTLLGWNTKGLTGCRDLDAMHRSVPVRWTWVRGVLCDAGRGLL